MGNAAPAATADRSALLEIEQVGAVLSVGLNRPAKRNALNDGIILASIFAVPPALPMIAEADPQTGLLMESSATVAQSDKEAKRRIREFLEHKAAKLKPDAHDRA